MSSSSFGIVGWNLYVPPAYVSQEKLETFDGAPKGKYTLGLGQTSMAVAEPCEDIVSMMLTATERLIEKADIDVEDVGRLEVGTETLVDKSKATKTSLMRLFGKNGDIEGVDTINACYGGTNALFNCLNWMSSPGWDGRYAIVVCGDIAVYESGPARPTGGAGVVAMLLGPNAPVEIDLSIPRATHMEDVYDFYKPIGEKASEYPKVDGHLSNACYHRAIDRCVERLAKKYTESGLPFDVRDFDHAIFHYPYGKLVQKSFGRYIWNQHRLFGNVDERLNPFLALAEEDTYNNRDLDKACMTVLNGDYEKKVVPSTRLGREVGNIYTGSLYSGLQSLVNDQGGDLDGKRALLFSYGSGSAATLFSANFRDRARLDTLKEMADVDGQLASREEVDPESFSEILKRRETVYGNYPIDVPPSQRPRPGTYYLKSVDAMGRRQYVRGYSTRAARWVSRYGRRFVRV